jgi:hypothetical protein
VHLKSLRIRIDYLKQAHSIANPYQDGALAMGCHASQQGHWLGFWKFGHYHFIFALEQVLSEALVNALAATSTALWPMGH